MEEYINLNDLIKDKIEENKLDPFNTLNSIDKEFNDELSNTNDNSEENNENNLNIEKLNRIYQIQIVNNTNKIIIKHVGNFKERPTIIIKKFKIKNYDINIVNYLLLDIDLEEIKKTNMCKIFGINIIKDGEIKYIIQLVCQLNDNNISDYLDTNLTVIPEIIFIKSTGQRKKLGTLNMFPNNNNNLFELLTKELLNPVVFDNL